jgi:hypothetical protein
MRRVTLVFVAVLVSVTCSAQSGPFGFKKGMTRSQIIALVGQKNIDPRTLRGGEILSMRTAPKPDPQFVGYMLLVPPAEGLLRVAALGRNTPVNDAGIELRGAYDAVVADITKQFGPPTNTLDDCNGPAILCKRPDNWMMTMYGKQRKLASRWHPDKPTKAMTDAGVEFISVEASASSMNSGFVACNFEFEGMEKYAAKKGLKRPSEPKPAEASGSDEQKPAQTTAAGDQKPAQTTAGGDQKPPEPAAGEQQKPAETNPPVEQKPPEKKQ